MRTNAKQLEIPLNAPDNVVTLCRTEAQAVQICLDIARRRFGRTQEQVALLCGWKTDTCLCEIAKESNSRRMPKTRRERFARATGCNLLNQYLDRKEAERLAASKPTERDRASAAADACFVKWGIAA